MPHRFLWMFLAASLSHLSPAYADGGTAIIARKACMKASNAAFNALLPMFKSEKPFEQKTVSNALSRIDLVCKDWKDFWPQDSQSVPGLETRVLPAIWSDPQAYQKSTDAYFAALKALAYAKSDAAFKESFETVGKSCASCHETYRGPEN